MCWHGPTVLPEFLRLLVGGGDEGGVAVAEDAAAEPGEEVEVAFAVGIPEVGAFAADHDEGKARVVGDEDLLAALEEFGGGGHWCFRSQRE